jgi:hypothetical protein
VSYECFPVSSNLVLSFSLKASHSVVESWICCFGCMVGYNEHYGFGRVGTGWHRKSEHHRCLFNISEGSW